MYNTKSWQQILGINRRLGFKALTHKANLLLGLCLLMSAMAASTLGFFSLNVKSALNRDIANFLGADLVVRSNQSIPPQIWQSLEQQPVITASMTHGASGPGGYHSIGLKTIADDYPLQGELRLSDANNDFSGQGRQLPIESAWLDARALTALGVQIGERIQIGEAFFTVTAEIQFEPDRLTQLQHALPRVMIHHDALVNTGLQTNTGRTEFRYSFSGDSEQLQQLQPKIEQQVKTPHQILTPSAGQHPFSRLVSRAEKMLGMVSVLVLLLCGSAAAMLATHTMRRYVYPNAVLRCMGVNRSSVSGALILQLLLLTLISGIMGSSVAWLIQPMLADLLAPHLILSDGVFDIKVPLLALFMALLVLMAFVYPQFRQLSRQTPVSILRGQQQTQPQWWLTTATASISVVMLLWYYSDNPKLTGYLVIGVVTVVLMTLLFGWLLNKLTGLSYHLTTGSFRLVLRSIGRTPTKHLATMATIGIAVMAFSMTAILRNGFIDTYHVQRIEFDGNFLYNSLPEDQYQAFEKRLSAESLEIKGSYPTVDALLVSINGKPVDSALQHESDSREEIRSPVRLSWSEQLPENNRLLQGQWPEPGTQGVSVEAEVMSDLGLEMGDVLGFQIGDQVLTTTISSNREYKSGGSRFMFWFMFAEDTLEPFQSNRMGGFTYHGDSKNLLGRLSQDFPTVRFIDLEQQMSRMRAIMHAMTTIMNSILVLLLSAAMTVLIASAFVHQHSGQYKWQLMRAIGTRKNRLRRMIILEYVLISSIACLVGILSAELIADTLFQQVFAVSFDGSSGFYVLILLLTTSVFALIGVLMSHLSLQRPIQLVEES